MNGFQFSTQMPSTQEQFKQANTEIRNGNLVRARELLLPLLQDAQLKIDAEHALAVVERKLGNLVAAAARFVNVLQIRSDDPHVHNNYANCLRDLEQYEDAMAHYQQALRLKSSYIDATVNLAMLQKNLGQIDEAEQTLRTGIRDSGESARLLHGLGSVLRDAGRHDEAAALLDKALGQSPSVTALLHLRALVEAERGKPSLPYYIQAVASAADNPEIRLGYAIAQLESGRGDEAIATLTALTREMPLWVPGHSALSQLKWQLGYGEELVKSFEEALQTCPSDRNLYIGYFATLMRAGKYQSVLDRLGQARLALADKLLLDRYEVACASESGDLERAAAFFDYMPEADDSELEIARIRFLLRSGRHEQAAANAERIARELDVMGAWPYLSIAWRLTGDPRSQWLDGGTQLYSFIDFPEMVPELKQLAAKLKGIHHGKEHPFDQSMRGGSQTDGNLFLRSDPELRRMRELIEQGVSEFIKQLPPVDPAHPFLRQPRNRFSFLASYSVHLKGNGYHINHMHPEAAISCCFYIDTPETLGEAEANPAGWLSLGMPPRELGLDLPPFALIKPVPGRLALFPSIMWHGTFPFPRGVRLTVVSDLILK